MKTAMKKYILMADIIKSSAKKASKLLPIFKSMVSEVNVEYKTKIESPLTITLGDEFQGVVDSLPDALSIIIEIEESLLSKRDFDLRFSLVYGKIETPINKEYAHEMLGEGLTYARKKLNDLKKSNNRFFFKTKQKETSDMLEKAFVWYQSIIDDWNQDDAKVAALFLDKKDYKEVAQILNKDKSTMWRRERSLKIYEYLTCKELIFSIASHEK